jgi:opacity protein-like surface antigen
MLVSLTRTRVSFTALGSVSLATAHSRSRAIGNARPAGIWAAFPLPLNLRLSAAVTERFNQDFDIWTESTAAMPYWYHIVGRGGIYGLRAGLSASLFNLAGIGLEYTRVLGGCREEWNFITGDSRYRSTDTLRMDYSGSALLAGLSFQHRLFTLAATFETGHDLAISRYKLVHGILPDTQQVYSLGLPGTLGLGLEAQPIDRLTLALGAEDRPWTGATLNNDPSDKFRNTWRLSIGLEYELTPNHPLRLGFSHGDWYCWNRPPSTSSPVPISEQGIHAGAGIPIARFGALDLAAVALLRRTRTGTSTLNETAFRLHFTLAYSEAWMRRTRRWGY